LNALLADGTVDPDAHWTKIETAWGTAILSTGLDAAGGDQATLRVNNPGAAARAHGMWLVVTLANPLLPTTIQFEGGVKHPA